MAGEHLTEQQRAFLQRHLKLSFFSKKKDKETTEAYERYLLVEDEFKTELGKLPGGEPRVQGIGGRSAPAMKLKNEGKFDDAAQALSPLTQEARNLGQTLKQEHAQALNRYQTAILPLPQDDPETIVIVNNAAGSLQPVLSVIDAATRTLDQAAILAGQREAAIRQPHAQAVLAYTTALTGLPPADPRVSGITGRAAAPSTVADLAGMPAATVLLGTLKQECDQLKITIAGEKTALLQDLSRLTDPPGISPHETGELARLRLAATQAMTPDWPAPDAFAAARKAMAALEKAIRSAGQVAQLPDSVKTKARFVLEGFDTILGDLELTPQVVADARTLRQQAEEAVLQASANLRNADALPQTSPQEILARNEAIRLATDALNLALQQETTVTERSNAILGKKMLTDALTFGALAPDAGNPLSEYSAWQVIDAFGKQPDIAQTGLELAQRSKDPDTLTEGLAIICDRVGNRFEDTNGTAYSSPDYARSYGVALLKQGDFFGGSYFTDLGAFLDNGGQFEPSVIGDGNGVSERDLTANRSRAMAQALLDSNGELDLGNGDAEKVLAQLKFSPDATLNPTPVLTQHIIQTFAQLSQGTNGTDATNEINSITAPGGPPASDLVGRSVGRGDGQVVTDEETRVAVLKSLLTPVDQGPVGSCFTTAPTRRFREEDPIGALRGMKEVATTGKFTSATGVEVPAVKGLPPGEDPILRSWEYSIASASATQNGSRERGMLGDAFVGNTAMTNIANIVGGSSPVQVQTTKNLVETELRNAFHFAYNPTKEVTDANDGSSSTGRFQILETDEFGAPTGNPIESPDQFVQVMTRRMLAKLNIDPTSTKGQQISDTIRDDMLRTVTPPPPKQPYKTLGNGDYKPWELQSGGLGLGPTQALYGNGVQTTRTLNGAPTNPLPSEGERSKEVLMNVLRVAQVDRTAKYQTIDSRGCHEYNALPTEPSLVALIGNSPQDTSDNIDALVRQGTDIANRTIALDRALALYEKQTQSWVDNETDPIAKQAMQTAVDNNRPTAPLLPADLKTRITTANRVAMDTIATARGGTQDEIDKRKIAFRKYAEDQALNALAIDLGPPQVVFADTNWGDGSSHTFFVMMPDPTTGELRMWQRTDPPGDLKPQAREDWIDKPMHITR